MSSYRRVRQQQIIREAEGYLDLVTALADRWPLSPNVRDQVAQRALNTLRSEKFTGTRRSEACYLEGQALLTMERYTEAITSLNRAAQLGDESIHVWLALGWCHKRTGRLDLAIQSLEEAMSVDNRQAIIHYNLACYWSLASNPKLALAYLSAAFDIDPNYRDLVAGETDFDPIRHHPEFLALTGVIV